MNTTQYLDNSTHKMNKYGKITQFRDTASYKSWDTKATATANLQKVDFRLGA